MRRPASRPGIDTMREALHASSDYIPGLVWNTVLITVVVGFQWNLLQIAVLYVLEIAVINLLYLLVSLFAPQPISDLDEERWNREPTPVQPVGWVPPVYYRNARFIVRYVLFVGILIPIVLQRLVAQYGLESVLTPSVGLAVVGIILFELRRVWQHFIRDRKYREKSPLEAIQFGFIHVGELFVILVYAIAPVTFILVITATAFGIDYGSRSALLFYLVPIGAIRVWFSSLDPLTDDFEVSIS
jgi:hypothetical protein